MSLSTIRSSWYAPSLQFHAVYALKVPAECEPRGYGDLHFQAEESHRDPVVSEHAVLPAGQWLRFRLVSIS